MRVNLSTLKGILLNNVADVRFVRKRPKPGYPETRRMLCTNSRQLLSSPDGRVTLNYVPPKGRRQVNERETHVVTTWDIMMQNYRCINAAQCDLVTTVPVGEFWEYFAENLAPLSPADKANYMNT
jgi:hypothetical protein